MFEHTDNTIDLNHLATVHGGADAPDPSSPAANRASEIVKSYDAACARGMSWGGPPGVGCVGNVVWNAIQRNR